MRRWLVLPLGIGIAALAGYVLLSGSTRAPAQRAASPAAPHDEIDEESRERLRAILRDADGQEVSQP